MKREDKRINKKNKYSIKKMHIKKHKKTHKKKKSTSILKKIINNEKIEVLLNIV